MDSKFYEGEPILQGGYSKLVDFLVTSLSDRATLRLNSKCRNIDWSLDSHITVTLENGDIVRAQYVVIALPLGVLKHCHDSMFQPTLPKNKIEIIEQLEFGLMDKIFLEFDETFWDSTEPGIQFIMTDEPESDDMSTTWSRNIAGFDSVCGQPNVLCGWIRYTKYNIQ